jgi:hypothetical protein
MTPPPGRYRPFGRLPGGQRFAADVDHWQAETSFDHPGVR